MNTNDDRLLVSNDDAMYQLGGIGRTMFYELVAAGEIEQVKIGRRSFITSKSIAAYVDRLRQAVPA